MLLFYFYYLAFGFVILQTRILVTHSVTFLPEVDLIIVMDDGHVVEIGKYQDLVKNKGAFAELLKTCPTPTDLEMDSNNEGKKLKNTIVQDNEGEKLKNTIVQDKHIIVNKQYATSLKHWIVVSVQ